MKYDYVFYQTDESFDYGDWSWGGTWNEYADHGFSIDIDSDGNVDINSLDAYGDYDEMNDKCKTLEELKQYILDHFNEIDDSLGSKFPNTEIFNELLEEIDCNLQKKVA